VDNVRHNVKQKPSYLRLFELGTCYEPEGKGKPPKEKRLLGGVMWGAREAEFWATKPQGVDFYDLKGVVEALVASFGLQGVRYNPIEVPFLQDAAQVKYENQILGFLGQLADELIIEFELGQPVYLFELDFERLAASRRPQKRAYEPIPKYPAIIRDMALVVPEDIPAQVVEDTIWATNQEPLRQVRLFDVYRGKPIATGYKSLAFSLCYQSTEHTLTEEEVNIYWHKVVEELKHKLGVTLRE